MSHQYCFGIDLMIDPLWCAWFSGLVDGEGSFLIAHNKPTPTRQGHFWPYLQLKFRMDDLPILEEIQATLHCGKLNKFSYGFARNRGGKDADQYGLYFQGNSNLMHIIIPLLDQFPLKTKKKNDYAIWRECVCFIHQQQSGSKNSEVLLSFKQRMEDARRPKSATFDEENKPNGS
ncbi:MAG: LAGLIDADG family homing endonuclease [Anaerolineae bacterium]